MRLLRQLLQLGKADSYGQRSLSYQGIKQLNGITASFNGALVALVADVDYFAL